MNKIGLCIKNDEINDLLNLCKKFNISFKNKNQFKYHHLYLLTDTNIYYISPIIMKNTIFTNIFRSVSELDNYLSKKEA
jgi:hypothetical protein